MDWERDLPNWSLPEFSTRIVNGPHRWHVQIAGNGPDILLLPGAGASTHTWRALIPTLARAHRVIAPDLPGQGFTQSPNAARSGLPETAEDLCSLARAEGWRPRVVVGHSAGAAIALELSGELEIPKVVGINPALDNFEGVAGWLFPIMAKLLAANPFTANLFTFGASRSRARRLIEGTGSNITDEGLEFYTRLISDRRHVNGALQMMAHWSLDGLLEELPKIEADVLFLVGENDKAVPPDVARRAAKTIPNATVKSFADLGHLAHEEDPDRILSDIQNFIEKSD